SASGKTAIVPAEGLFIVVIKHRHEMLLFKDLIPQKRYKVAVGINSGDKLEKDYKATPEGNFRIEEIEDSSWWLVKKRSKVPSIYGPWFLRLETGKENTFSGNAWLGFGIHGTNEPESIGTYASNGCIRLKNEDLVELKAIVEPVLEHKLVRVLVIP
ncbi:MAG: L,D-transpeptidase, partial [Candidatus Cloacimonadaceae bacterium]|nr:L,D-transpeptidase [Candidatus Cloacimonadaceae bacterium]